MTGVVGCLRLLLRTTWVSVLGWPVVMTVLLWSAAASILDLYPDAAHRELYAQAVTGSVATSVFQGRGYDLTTVGGILAQEMGIITLTLFPLVGAHIAVHLTRSLEDRGHLDIVLAGPVGRFAPVVAGMLASTASAVLVGVLGYLTLLGAEYPGAGSARYAAALTLLMVWASSLGLLAGQLARTSRDAHQLAFGIVLLCYLVRGFVDVERLDATWSTPMSWLAEVRPFASSPPVWPAVAFAVVAVVLSAAALWVTAHRDLGGGVMQPRPGRAEASPVLRGPTALVARLTRAPSLAFLVGGGVVAFVFGLFARDMASEGLEARLVLLVQVNALLAAAVAVRCALVTAQEERAGRTGRVLAAPLSRERWLGSAGLVAAGWSLLMLAWAGLLSGLGLAIALEDDARVADGLRDAMSFAAPVLLVGALTVLLGAISPRLAPLGWVVVVWAAVVALRADLLRLSDTARHLSPLEWMGKVPLETWDRGAAAGMAAVAVALFAVSLVLLRRRDLVAG
ncbi:ABC transporter permease [Cellulomonas sp. zg-ZUI22]|uniref:ABC transporter permease n=1 Tax=Cellulomonas sp. zg-ZUI22 TaxID=2816955 RepID=UPI001A9533BF|nr:ABC transporter permease [Cellulomonas sp. zg-ZUI22]MBO0901525.1 ABC transporter permease [Cellulomonas sp. zg-ZUI22]